MLSRSQRTLFALLCCVSLAGCAGDLLWWPGFNPATTSYINQIPVHDVAFEVQCEIYRFLDQEKMDRVPVEDRILDPSKGAGVVLTLQTDLSGSVQYVGVDLSKLGFPSLATLVAATNKLPSLQAKATGHATVSAEVDFTIAQSKTGPKVVTPKPAGLITPGPTLIKESEMKEPYQIASFNNDPTDPGVFQPHPANVGPTKPVAQEWPTVNCRQNETYYQPYLELWLDKWLSRYETYEETNRVVEPYVCNTKVTLKSMFQILVDVSAGVNAFMTPPIVLPISGFNVDASPDYQHSIAITFALKNNSTQPGYCKALGVTQPATK